MRFTLETRRHRAGDPTWNAVRAALVPFVAIYAPGGERKLERMTDAVMRAIAEHGSKQVEHD